MDAIGLALAISSASGMHILKAGNGIDPPSGASAAIVCVTPDSAAGSNYDITIGEQVYIVTNGESCTIALADNTGVSRSIWDWGDQNSNVNVIYLG